MVSTPSRLSSGSGAELLRLRARAEQERRRRVAAAAELAAVEEAERVEGEEPEPDEILAWTQQKYYVPEPEVGLIQLMPFQGSVLRYGMQRNDDGSLKWRCVVWSEPKKSGKTTISGAAGKYAATKWGPYQEILCVGNDADQAKDRAFASVRQSIELTPGYHPGFRELAGQWRVRDDTLTNLLNGSRLRAIAADYKGEAGVNPSMTIWTELWGFIDKAHLRFWAEMAPSPTRALSMRWVETYAGYEGESELLYGLYESTVKNGRQLRVRELEAMFDSAELTVLLRDGPLFAESPDLDDLVPCYVNEQAATFAFWDDGVIARRMPWQQGERGRQYYASEAATQTASQMIRLHENRWVSAESAFIPIEWWDACLNPLPLTAGDKTPIVIAIDAGVTNDCFGLVAISRDPDRPDTQVAVRLSRKWTPAKGGAIDFDGPRNLIRELCGFRPVNPDDPRGLWRRVPGAGFNVVQIAYDPYQLHDFATQLQKDGIGWFREFSQGQDRAKADKGLYDLIRDRRIRHDGNLDVREHLTNANAKLQKDADSTLRIVKKSETRKVDLAVCLSMGSYECLRLNL